MRAFIAFFAALSLTCCGSTQRLDERAKLIIAGETFTVEVARTMAEQTKGLMFRRQIGRREGMIFVYDADRHLSFWMKNTLIPLSIAFISRDGIVQQIEDMEPESLRSIPSERAVRFALEVKQGVFDELGVRVGDRIRFPPGFY